jgi:RNA recognition motif-containing protein
MQDLFARFGPVVSCRVIMDHDSGRSKGYGFVTMASATAATAAVSGLDGQQLPGAAKSMSVKIADNRQGGGRASFQTGDHHSPELVLGQGGYRMAHSLLQLATACLPGATVCLMYLGTI